MTKKLSSYTCLALLGTLVSSCEHSVLLPEATNLERYANETSRFIESSPDHNQKIAAVTAHCDSGFGDSLGEDSFGEGSMGDDSFGQGSFGEDSFGQDSFGEDSFGEDSFGQDSFGEDSFGEDSMGDDSFGQESFGEDSMGDDSFGEDSMGDDSFGQDSFGEDSFGQGTSGDDSMGDDSFGQDSSNDDSLDQDTTGSESMGDDSSESNTGLTDTSGEETLDEGTSDEDATQDASTSGSSSPGSDATRPTAESEDTSSSSVDSSDNDSSGDTGPSAPNAFPFSFEISGGKFPLDAKLLGGQDSSQIEIVRYPNEIEYPIHYRKLPLGYPQTINDTFCRKIAEQIAISGGPSQSLRSLPTVTLVFPFAVSLKRELLPAASSGAIAHGGTQSWYYITNPATLDDLQIEIDFGAQALTKKTKADLDQTQDLERSLGQSRRFATKFGEFVSGTNRPEFLCDLYSGQATVRLVSTLNTGSLAASSQGLRRYQEK